MSAAEKTRGALQNCCLRETLWVADICSWWWSLGFPLWFCPTSNSVPPDNPHWQRAQQKSLSTADFTGIKVPGVFQVHRCLTSSPLTCSFSQLLTDLPPSKNMRFRFVWECWIYVCVCVSCEVLATCLGWRWPLWLAIHPRSGVSGDFSRTKCNKRADQWHSNRWRPTLWAIPSPSLSFCQFEDLCHLFALLRLSLHLYLLTGGQEVEAGTLLFWCLCQQIESRPQPTHTIRTNDTEIWDFVHTRMCVCVCFFLKCTISVWVIALWIIGLVI